MPEFRISYDGKYKRKLLRGEEEKFELDMIIVHGQFHLNKVELGSKSVEFPMTH